MNKKIELLIEKIKNAKNIAISGHKNPDGDAIGSALALMRVIELNFGKKVTVIYDGNIPMGLDEIPLRDRAIFYNKIPEDSKFDLYIVVDYGTRNHLGGAEKFVNESDFVIEFDHHYNEDLVGSLCFDNVEKAATAQIIYDVIKRAKLQIDQDIIDLLTIAIITDTGSFKFARKSDVLIDTASLVDAGADLTHLVNLIRNKKKKTVLVESKAVANAEFLMRARLAIASIRQPDYKKLDGRGDIVLNLLAEIHGVEYVVLLKEQKENQIGISLRSKNTPINQIAESLGGGGHLCAAGAVVNDSFDNVYKNIVNAFKGM